MTTVASSDPRIAALEVTEDAIIAQLVEGRVISVPLVWSWRLSNATPAQRCHFEIIGAGEGVHWPDINEDVSARGMLQGTPACPSHQAAEKHPATPVGEPPASEPRSGTATGTQLESKTSCVPVYVPKTSCVPVYVPKLAASPFTSPAASPFTSPVPVYVPKTSCVPVYVPQN